MRADSFSTGRVVLPSRIALQNSSPCVVHHCDVNVRPKRSERLLAGKNDVEVLVRGQRLRAATSGDTHVAANVRPRSPLA